MPPWLETWTCGGGGGWGWGWNDPFGIGTNFASTSNKMYTVA